MFARIISPSPIRTAGTQQTAVAVAGTAGTTTVAASSGAIMPTAASTTSNKDHSS